MNNTSIYHTSNNDHRQIDPLAMLFFFLGALHIYTFLRRKKLEESANNSPQSSNWFKVSQVTDFTKLAFIGLFLAGAIEVYHIYS